jgi:hypothetical protein
MGLALRFLRHPAVFALVALAVGALWLAAVASRDKGDS